ncbi:MAG: restriction endonuclease [Candidatus Pacebacteria bacterium]|nr:restriction endonuclease [Candidatus Paceibacterota bacterium]
MNRVIYVTKSNGGRELFEEGKLVESLRAAGGSNDAIDDIVGKVEEEMKDGMSTALIYARAFDLLRSSNLHHAAARYSLRRALAELGPNGYPFEKFVAEIFKAWGYETTTDMIVQGHCVQHEVDVVAWKDDKLDMVEAKFHNEFGLKSDLKVALYVKARFEDLADRKFTFGGRERMLDKGWLITNTKFTSEAIKYAECRGLNLIGWNYPHTDNLHHLIDKYSLYPFTILASVDGAARRSLFQNGVVLCRDLVKYPGHLEDAGVKGVRAEKIINEAKMMCKI